MRDPTQALTTKSGTEHTPSDPLALVRLLVARQSHTGGLTKDIAGPSAPRMAELQGVNPMMWEWRACLSAPWTHLGEHINILEARAYMATLRWRLRKADNMHARFLHLLDSAVVLAVMSRGRARSRRLRPIVQRTAAVVLAGFVWPVLVYVRSHLNPADAPSRRAIRSA